MRRDGSKVRKMKVPAMDKVKNHQTSMEFRRPDFQANNARSEAFHSAVVHRLFKLSEKGEKVNFLKISQIS